LAPTPQVPTLPTRCDSRSRPSSRSSKMVSNAVTTYGVNRCATAAADRPVSSSSYAT
jgi:hypothetical protein